MKTFPALAKIAGRNVLLNKRRSLFITVILVVGCTGILMIGGFFQGVLTTLREQFIHGMTGHLMIAKSGYYDHGAANPFKYLFKNDPGLIGNLPHASDVSLTIPRLQFGGLLTTDRKINSVNIIGVDPERENLMSKYGNGSRNVSTLKIVAGADLDPKQPDGILIGKGLSKILKVHVGDELSLITTTQSGSIDGANYRVQGIFESPIREFENNFTKINLASAQKVLNAGGSVTSLLVMLKSTGLTTALKREISAHLAGGGFEVLDWEERGSFYRNGRDLLQQINAVVQLVFAALILFSIASSVNMSFFERIREFGMMMALGNTRLFIFLLISMETLIVGFFGMLAGLGVGYTASLAVSKLDLTMPALPGATSGYAAQILLSPDLFLKVAAVGVIASLASSMIVSMRAYRLNILSALGYL